MFWRFSCAVYAAPGVQEACLALQDQHGLDVNLALLCAWVGAARSGAMSEEDIAAAAALVEDWHDEVIRPLRSVRRRIKLLPLMSDPSVQALRERLAAIELEAEQLQQAILYRWADPRWPACDLPPGGRALPNLKLLLARLPGVRLGDAASTVAMLAEAAERHAALSAR